MKEKIMYSQGPVFCFLLIKRVFIVFVLKPYPLNHLGRLNPLTLLLPFHHLADVKVYYKGGEHLDYLNVVFIV